MKTKMKCVRSEVSNENENEICKKWSIEWKQKWKVLFKVYGLREMRFKSEGSNENVMKSIV